MINRNKVCVVGGAGHVGLPLGLAFSSKGYDVSLIDKDKKNIKKINQAEMPFIEEGCSKLLKKMIYKKKIFATNNLNEVKNSKFIVNSLTKRERESVPQSEAFPLPPKILSNAPKPE